MEHCVKELEIILKMTFSVLHAILPISGQEISKGARDCDGFPRVSNENKV